MWRSSVGIFSLQAGDVGKLLKNRQITEAIDGKNRFLIPGMSDLHCHLSLKRNVAIVPTLGVGSYLAMDCGTMGYPDHPEYRFFREMLVKYVKPNMEKATIPQLQSSCFGFYDFIQKRIEDRKMPGVGKVYADRCHGFGVYAPRSFENFHKAGTPIGIGTDGGTGICFAGALTIEFEGLLRYGFSPKEILRMATQ